MSEETKRAEQILAEADRVIEDGEKRLAEYEAEHGPIKRFKSFKEFIEQASIGDGFFVSCSTQGPKPFFGVPDRADFYCDSAKCGRLTEFYLIDRDHQLQKFEKPPLPGHSLCLNYICRLCDAMHSISLRMEGKTYLDANRWTIKIGEWPRGGEPVSKSLESLVGDGKCKDLLKKGYECEWHKKGIGAYAYYRRIIEYRTKAIITKLKEIATITECPQAVIDKLDSALAVTGYERQLELANEVAPGILVTVGHPFLTLHRFVSGGVHKGSDAECLEDAMEARLMLQYVAGRMQSVLADHEAMMVALNKAKKRTDRVKAGTDVEVT